MRLALLLPLFMFSCLSCTSPEATHDNNTIKTNALFDAFNRHDWKTMASYYADSSSFLDPSFGSDYVIKSRNETITKYSDMQKMFPDINDEVVGVYPSGDKVTVEFISTGTAADGSQFKLPIISVLTFRDGLIIRDATYYDNP